MSARPHHRVLLRVRQRMSGMTWFWLVEADGVPVPVRMCGRFVCGRLVLSLREPLR